MNSTRSALLAITASLVASPYAHAATGNVDVYGVINSNPTSGVYSAAADIGTNLFSETPFVPTISVTDVSGQTAEIALTDYSAHAKTTLGNNHAYAQSNGFNNGAFGVNSFSGWYDQVTITGGTGTGTLQFSVHLSGFVNSGAEVGVAKYRLGTSGVHPAAPSTTVVNGLGFGSHSMGLIKPSVDYLIGTSPYIDLSILNNLYAIQANTTAGEGFYEDTLIPEFATNTTIIYPITVSHNLVAPGSQLIDVTLEGSAEFVYGEAFYLVGVST